MNNSSAVLILDKVSKSYGNGLAVDEVSLNIRENEFFALLGPSGCGKTTLLRMLAGFETPSGGCIYLDGKDISPLPANKRPLNLMFQSYALFPNMTVRKNIAYGLEMERLPEAEIRRRVDEVLSTAQLGSWPSASPISCPVASVNGSPWRGRWSSVRGYCCSMSHWVRWIKSCGKKCSWNSSACNWKAASPSSSSPTIRKKRW
jgi:ABC-type sugar transport system ATPase subunit